MRTKLLTQFYQVSSPSKFPWHGVKSTCAEDKARKKNRVIELKTTDILVKSGDFYHRISKNGAVNIEIPENKLVCRNVRILFDDNYYNKGFSNSEVSV